MFCKVIYVLVNLLVVGCAVIDCITQESNHGKIEYELLNRIRVVSGQSFTFPIWIDNVVVPVRVGKTVRIAVK